MSSYFVTATGTDIGKTHCTAGLLRACRALGTPFAAIKPILSGYDAATAATSDPAYLLAAMGRPVTTRNIAAISPWRFAAPLSPDMAAARERRRINFDDLITFCQTAQDAAADNLLIEGVGGVAVPLDATHLVIEWIETLRLPTLLVAGVYLGTISHTITAAEALLSCGVDIAAILLNDHGTAPVPPQETAETLRRFLPAQDIFIIPRNNQAAAFTTLARSL
jgi:dethiobiotin synthetase